MKKGDRFRIKAEPQSVFTFDRYASNGDILAFGGSKNPNGVRMFRAFSANTKLLPIKGKK